MDLSDQKTQLMLLGVMGILGLIYVWFTYMFSPRNEQINELEAQVTELSGEVQQLEVKVRTLPRMEAQVQELQQRWEETLRSFPTESKEEEVLNNLTISEQTSGLYITEIERQGIRDMGLYVEEFYAVSMLGRFNDLDHFIRELVGMPRRMTVEYIQLSGPFAMGSVGAAAGGAGALSPEKDEVIISCMITTYRVKEGG